MKNRALFLLTAVNYLSYIDRFMLASLLSSIQKDLALSDLQGGLLATAFMLAYVITSPISGWIVQRVQRSLLLGVGVAIWSAASLMTGLSGEFAIMMSSRFLLGLGESIFTTVAAPFLTDFFAVEKRGRAFSIFASAAPAGAALGYILGGLLGEHLGWRHSFLIAGFPGFVLAFFIWRLPEPRHEEMQEQFKLKESLALLVKNRPFVCAVLGYTAYTFVVGGLAHWMPSYIQRSFSTSVLNASMIFGGVAVVSGFLGTLLGGYWGDKINLRRKFGYLYFSAFCMLAVVPFFIACFYAVNLQVFITLLALTQFLFFLPTGPINVLILESVPFRLRTMAMAMAIFACHILGDAISSPLIGLVSDHTGSIRSGMVWCAPVVFLAGVFWFVGMRSGLESK